MRIVLCLVITGCAIDPNASTRPSNLDEDPSQRFEFASPIDEPAKWDPGSGEDIAANQRPEFFQLRARLAGAGSTARAVPYVYEDWIVDLRWRQQPGVTTYRCEDAAALIEATRVDDGITFLYGKSMRDIFIPSAPSGSTCLIEISGFGGVGEPIEATYRGNLCLFHGGFDDLTGGHPYTVEDCESSGHLVSGTFRVIRDRDRDANGNPI